MSGRRATHPFAFALGFVAALLLVWAGTVRPSVATATFGDLGSQDGSPERGQALFGQYCSICHTMDGRTGAGLIGPDLADFASRSLIADAVPNTTDNLVRWIVNPPAVKRGTAMPQLGLT